ncbi:hypothetical protein MM_2560 [Methanosarcina mazei Go1]|uniref:RiboL-PSP-HEPN domain-containing protein n=1 Tax=Methanosarcina mazei (strain ATCC BAA-159 / DSM 3647 / Goe1 / Go1 / JCM 11833 / OCM 88) TaxID=192952 RepID=Q8PTZ7_METMA|nr:MAE_28990/MAE_18760 family HEPN-like nuclease [Methanosarcina mazei]AAM32256.1 hypothetical protein MM_2560 [Methanosarcina mazei Go1]WIM42506.1 MAE_28990/MAE_18760 family HEPN-like nuclease [Methanosarcina mazei]
MRASYDSFIGEISNLNSLLDRVEELGSSPQYLPIKAISSKSAIIMSSGLLEKYMKESFMEFIEQINEMNISEEYIDDKMWKTNRKNTLKALEYIDGKKLEADYEKVVFVYSESFRKNEKLNKPLLVKEAFSITNANPGPETVKNMFSNIGISKIFENTFFQLEFGNEKFGDETRVTRTLKSFIELRNCIAHGYSGIPIPSIQEVQEYIKFLMKFVYTMNEVLNQRLLIVQASHYKDCFKALDLFCK